MPDEWILNGATNRWLLNQKKNVGATSDEIRRCQPKTVADWESYYYTNVRPREHIDGLGRKLYVKVTEVLAAEIDSVTEEDCVRFMHQLVIKRTFDGYQREIQTVYGQLQKELGVSIVPAPDHWDRHYNVDFFIEVNGYHIGLQIKPVGHAYITQIIKEKEIQAESHKRFNAKYGGPVFYILSIKEGDAKIIHNLEVVDQIRSRIEHYRNLPAK